MEFQSLLRRNRETLLSYQLSDFVLFSEQVYWRLFERLNNQVGVWLVLFIALGLFLVPAVWSRRPALFRAAAAVLAAFWMSSAVLFVWQFYTPVNWAARYSVGFLLLEAVLLGALSASRQLTRTARRDEPRVWLGMMLLGYAVAIHPFNSLLFGRTLDSAGVIGLSPDATAIATLGFLLVKLSRPALWWLLPIPVVVCCISGLTLYGLRTPEAWSLVVVLLVTFVALMVSALNLRGSDEPVTTKTGESH